MPKPPSQRQGLTHRVEDAAEKLADELADKPFGQAKQSAPEKPAKEKFKKLSISLPEDMANKIITTAHENNLSGTGLKTHSAIIRDALEKAGW